MFVSVRSTAKQKLALANTISSDWVLLSKAHAITPHEIAERISGVKSIETADGKAGTDHKVNMTLSASPETPTKTPDCVSRLKFRYA